LGVVVDYKHLPLFEEARAIAGGYWIVEEARLAYRGREVLVVVAETDDIVTCGATSCGERLPPFHFVTIPGYVKAWKHKKGRDGLLVSRVEPVEDAEERDEIRRVVWERWQPDRIDFLGENVTV
jgi:hypothetical protein